MSYIQEIFDFKKQNSNVLIIFTATDDTEDVPNSILARTTDYLFVRDDQHWMKSNKLKDADDKSGVFGDD